MNIAISLNQKYFRYAFVMLYSLFKNNSEQEIDVYILNSDLERESIREYELLAEEYGNCVHELRIDNSIFPEGIPVTKIWSIEAYYRLVLLDILPADVDRLLYLDVDIIVNKDIQDMYSSDFSGKLILAVEDDFNACPSGKREVLFRNYLKQGMVYFNSGVMLLDVKALRKHYSFKRYMETLQKIMNNIVAPDQDLLNYVHWQEVGFLDAGHNILKNKYNMYARRASIDGYTYEQMKEEAYIIHCFSRKPWDADSTHYEGERIWWEYARKTKYYESLSYDYVCKSMTDQTINNTIRSYEDIINRTFQANAVGIMRSLIAENYDYYYIESRLRRSSDKEADILITGSHYGLYDIADGVDKRIMNLSGYGQYIDESYKLAKKAIDLRRSTNISMYGTCVIMLGYTLLFKEKSEDVIHNNEGKADSRWEEINKQNPYLTNEHRNICDVNVTAQLADRDYFNEFHLREYNDDGTLKANAWSLLPQEERIAQIWEIIDEDNQCIEKREIFEKNATILKDYIMMLNDNKIRAIVMIPPYVSEYEDGISEKFEEKIIQILDDMPWPVEYVNLNNENIFEDRDFFDYDSLNQIGCGKLGKLL